MKNKISWKFLLIGAVIGYFLQYVIGGIIGNFFGVLAIIFLVLGIVDFFASRGKPKNK